MSAAADQPREPEPHGSLAEEALRLVEALSGRGHEHPEEQSASYAEAGSAECEWCPLCRALRVVRATRPEVREHLAAAGASLLAALGAALAPPADMMGPDGADGPAPTTKETDPR